MKKRHALKSSGVRLGLESKTRKKEKRRLRRIERKLEASNQNYNQTDEGYGRLIAKAIPNDDIKVEMRPLMEAGIIPKPLSSVVFVGGTGTGKTNTLLNWLMHPDFYKDYFSDILLFSSTARLDPLFQKAGIKKKNIFDTNIKDKLSEILATQKKEVESKGSKKAKLKLLIFEDSTSNNKLLKSRDLIQLFTAGRHLRLTVFIVVHKYRSIPPVIRLNASSLVIFPSNNGQLQQIYEDYGQAGVAKRDFYQLVRYAWSPSSEDKRPYLYVDNKDKMGKKYLRKGLYEYLCPQGCAGWESEEEQ